MAYLSRNLRDAQSSELRRFCRSTQRQPRCNDVPLFSYC